MSSGFGSLEPKHTYELYKKAKLLQPDITVRHPVLYKSARTKASIAMSGWRRDGRGGREDFHPQLLFFSFNRTPPFYDLTGVPL